MNKLKKSLTVIITLLVLLLIISTKAVYGTNTKEIEYSKEYKNWLELSDEEKEKVMQPRMYDVIPINEIPDNLLYKVKLLGASANSRYSLKDVIPDNLSIRNQQRILRTLIGTRTETTGSDSFSRATTLFRIRRCFQTLILR